MSFVDLVSADVEHVIYRFEGFHFRSRLEIESASVDTSRCERDSWSDFAQATILSGWDYFTHWAKAPSQGFSKAFSSSKTTGGNALIPFILHGSHSRSRLCKDRFCDVSLLTINCIITMYEIRTSGVKMYITKLRKRGSSRCWKCNMGLRKRVLGEKSDHLGATWSFFSICTLPDGLQFLPTSVSQFLIWQSQVRNSP